MIQGRRLIFNIVFSAYDNNIADSADPERDRYSLKRTACCAASPPYLASILSICIQSCLLADLCRGWTSWWSTSARIWSRRRSNMDEGDIIESS